MDERMVGKVLRRAAELVRQGWCQNALARDESGRDLGQGAHLGQGAPFITRRRVAANPKAVSWCFEGAVYRAAHELGVDVVLPWRAATEAVWRESVTIPWAWNDAEGRTAEDVATLLERAAGEP